MKPETRRAVLGILLLLAVLTGLFGLAGHAEYSTWTQAAVNNWKQYGWATLGGKMVTNPGGFQVLEAPQVYAGHRAASLYPVYLIEQLFSWTGHDQLAFHLVFSLLLFGATKSLIGNGRIAWIVAALAVLCPGYTIYPAYRDPNAISLYATIPYAALVLPLMRHPRLNAGQLTLLISATLLYSALNWTSAFGHAMVFVTVWASHGIARRNLATYTIVAGLGTAMVLGLSVWDKLHASQTIPAPTVAAEAGGGLIGSYMWGSSGYGLGMTLAKAIARITFTNALGLLPLLATLGVAFISARRTQSPLSIKIWLPILTAVAGVLTLRNYFGHHPWMAVTMLLPGLVFTLHLMLSTRQCAIRPPPTVSLSRQRCFAYVSLGGLCLLHSFAIVFAQRAYSASKIEVSRFVLAHTDRTDTVALFSDFDAEMAAQAGVLAVHADRRIVVMTNLIELTPSRSQTLLLTSAPQSGGWPLVAVSTQPAYLDNPLIRKTFSWYAQRIARRSKHDKHFDFANDRHFYLYHIPPERQTVAP
ncbi:MAG: hypothetical protein QM813_20830 [Verrucomicrobiota bacterium]